MKTKIFMKSAFTLSEVLITLGVIGVVAALTIPGLMTAHKKHVTATKLERAVSVITQAIRLSENENGQMENWNKSLPYDEFINTYFRPFMNIMQVCNSTQRCGYKAGNLLYETPAGAYGLYNSPFNYNRHGILTADGFCYFYAKDGNGCASNDKMIIVDINCSEKPNVLGKDVFFLVRDEDADSVIPYGSSAGKASIKRSCSDTGDGLYCAAWIRENGWKIPDGYLKL